MAFQRKLASKSTKCPLDILANCHCPIISHRAIATCIDSCESAPTSRPTPGSIRQYFILAAIQASSTSKASCPSNHRQEMQRPSVRTGQQHKRSSSKTWWRIGSRKGSNPTWYHQAGTKLIELGESIGETERGLLTKLAERLDVSPSLLTKIRRFSNDFTSNQVEQLEKQGSNWGMFTEVQQLPK